MDSAVRFLGGLDSLHREESININQRWVYCEPSNQWSVSISV